jgi:radical SAM superfamily enzyme YgiQ (UPF0313 family)
MAISYSNQQNIANLLKKENGTIRKVFGTCHSAGICFPNTYYIGSSNLGFHFLYNRINQHNDFLAERFFADRTLPFSLERLRSLNMFDIVMFSIPFELDFAEVLRVLKTAGIPIRRKDRTRNDPLVLCGGIAVTMNPLPLYDFADLFFLGDGEETLPFFLDAFCTAGGDKGSLLDALKMRKGFLVPEDNPDNLFSLYEKRAVCLNLDQHPLSSVYITSETEFANTCLIEITRGCPYRCSFCYVGYNQHPFRIRSLESIKQIVNQNRALTHRFGFISSAVTSHPEIRELCEWCVQEKFDISFSSLRAEDLSPFVLEILQKSGQRTMTLAPETGSDAFRRSINKSLTNNQILESSDAVVKTGIRNLKLYFILGLPGETQKEIEASVNLVKAIQSLAMQEWKKRKLTGEITVSVSFFVPKPGTPFADFTPMEIPELKKRQQFFLSELKRIPHVKAHPANPHDALAQALLSRGGRETSELLFSKINGPLSWKAALKKLSL